MAPVSTKVFTLVPPHAGFCYKSVRCFGHLTHTHKLQRHFGLTLAIHGSFRFHHFAGACLMEQGLHLFSRGRAFVPSHGRMGFWGLGSRRGTSLFGGPRFICCCLLHSAGTNPPWNASTVPARGSSNDPKFSGGTASRSVGVAHKRNNYRGVSYYSSHTSPPHCIGLKVLPAFTRVGVKQLPGSLNLFLSG